MRLTKIRTTLSEVAICKKKQNFHAPTELGLFNLETISFIILYAA